MGGSSRWSKYSVLASLLLNLETEVRENVRDRQTLLSESSGLPRRASSIRSRVSVCTCRLRTRAEVTDAVRKAVGWPENPSLLIVFQVLDGSASFPGNVWQAGHMPFVGCRR